MTIGKSQARSSKRKKESKLDKRNNKNYHDIYNGFESVSKGKLTVKRKPT